MKSLILTITTLLLSTVTFSQDHYIKIITEGATILVKDEVDEKTQLTFLAGYKTFGINKGVTYEVISSSRVTQDSLTIQSVSFDTTGDKEIDTTLSFCGVGGYIDTIEYYSPHGDGVLDVMGVSYVTRKEYKEITKNVPKSK